MTYSKAINMAISAITGDKILSPSTKQEIIEALAYAEESALIGLAFQQYGNHFGVDIDEVVDFFEEHSAHQTFGDLIGATKEAGDES